ncbi:hypothetical protein M0805_004967 [Coniferiporia weirii]|nr:hypothetical protein M0805_004967 [Coniferiporia weirii]
MVGMVDPSASAPKQPERPPAESWWKGAFANPVQVKRPAQGKFSPKTDERCFTWCSQSVRGRHEGADPWCRSVCVRRVFAHEVRQLTSHFSNDAAAHRRASLGVSPVASQSGAGAGVVDHPLPPEGQPESAIVDGIVGGPPALSSPVSSGSGSGSFNPPRSSGGGEEAEGVRYWREGWYVWMTKNRWAAQERMDLMMLDLEKQTAWMRTKEQEERAWAEVQRVRERERERTQGVVNESGRAEDAGQGMRQEQDEDEEDGPPRHPYPNAAEESFLIRIPSQLPPLDLYARQTLAPTRKVLEILHTSIENGDQREFARRAWETAWSGAPFTLVRNVFKVCVDTFRKGPGDEGE